ncbi:hypothetical protein CYMTET_52283 [Cymbomonas tetramitiformis]|uniref:F-box domain-containing protein n=1 Tax=Cymbomonas tetramitiformis TaxID=36881 RepID=A0AAE0BKM6_9CHLO|nr:hypothetical protein CYMTET_52283 [Cymbomonas tetramitiformis]
MASQRRIELETICRPSAVGVAIAVAAVAGVSALALVSWKSTRGCSEFVGTPFLELPESLTFNIFHHIPLAELLKCRRISRRLQQLIDGYLELATEINLSDVVPPCDPSALRRHAQEAGTHDALRWLVHKSNLVQLVNVSGTSTVDAGLQHVAQHCKNLKLLDVAGCPGITDDGLKAIAECCSGLTGLDLVACTDITDYGMKPILAKCAQLQRLEPLFEACEPLLKKNKGLY